MEIYEKKMTAPAEGLSTRELFRWLQDIANEQCIGYHLTGDDLEKKGLMWVVIRYLVRAPRWPEPGRLWPRCGSPRRRKAPGSGRTWTSEWKRRKALKAVPIC